MPATKESDAMSEISAVVQAIPWFAWVPIVAIIAVGVLGGVRMYHRHAERMAMIQAGINPDDPPKG
jgi:hypothetical protein